ncbi:MAG: nucleotidyltransferase [Desulfomonile tiedjei]|nr:nucleotidyltransferase [Desulfomonile tiedjei]
MTWLPYSDNRCFPWIRPPMTMGQRFQAFLDCLMLTSKQQVDGYVKCWGVVSCLNRHYYGVGSSLANTIFVGSWGKATEIRPPRDIDLLFILPESVYYKYQWLWGNRQSRLLQEVRGVLGNTYSRTQLRGDGQVVVIPFDSYAVELLPAFALENGKYLICNTHRGGSYKVADPTTEILEIEVSDRTTSGNTRDLIRIIKRWQEYCQVPLKSFWIELLCMEFLAIWPHSGKGYIWYDLMVRDFFAHLLNRSFSWLFAPGTCEPIFLGENWRSQAETAHRRATTACTLDSLRLSLSAADEWRLIFGPDFPSM